MAKTTKNKTEIKTALLDRKLNEAFDTDKKIPVRVVIWNYEMEKNGQDTMKTAEAVKWELKASDDEIEDFVKKNIL